MFPQKLINPVIAVVLGAALSVSLTARGDSNPIFQEAVNAYQAGQFDQAREKFIQLRENPRWKFAALYNLGNVAMRHKKTGEAIGFYRMALQEKPLDPDTRSNLGFALAGLGIRQFPGAKSTWELYRVEILNSMNIDQVLAVLVIVSFFFFFNLYKFIKRRKLASFDEEPVPSQPPFIFFLWAVLFLFAGSTSVAKVIDSFTERATIVASKVDLRSGPGEANAALTDLGEGYEVQVRDNSNGWKQVTSLDGPHIGMTGWVPDSALMSTSGGGPW